MTDPFNNQTVANPEDAATKLGDILSFFHGEAFKSPISTGTGAQGTQANASVATSSGADTSSPVPQGTSVTGAYGEDRGNGVTHPGLDLGVPDQSQILAATSGTVTHAADDDPNGYGAWIEIQAPNGIITRYGHMSGMNVKVGDTIHAGQIIGKSGGNEGEQGAGNSKGAHLHFEVRVDGHTVDPTPFLAGGYQIVGGHASSTDAISADPRQIAAVQLQNVVNVMSGQDISNTTTTTGTTAQAGTASNTGDFARDVLAGIGAPVTAENLRVMEAWMRAEGGAEHNNPLNTTQGAEGATDFNSVGVKTYKSYQQGVQATIETLMNGYYANIISALRQGTSARAVADAIAASPWGTGTLVQQIVSEG